MRRVGDYRSPILIVNEVKHFLDKIGIDPNINPEELVDHELLTVPHIAAMFANTISLTMLRAGEKENVIPSKAEGVLDCRLLPGVKADDFMKELQEVIADKNLHMDIINTFDASTSPLDTEMYKALVDILTENYPDVQVLPTISAGFTDSRLFRKTGTVCYGILPFVADIEILSTMHGHDERIPVESFEKGIKVIFELIERLNALYCPLIVVIISCFILSIMII